MGVIEETMGTFNLVDTALDLWLVVFVDSIQFFVCGLQVGVFSL